MIEGPEGAANQQQMTLATCSSFRFEIVRYARNGLWVSRRSDATEKLEMIYVKKPARRVDVLFQAVELEGDRIGFEERVFRKGVGSRVWIDSRDLS